MSTPAIFNHCARIHWSVMSGLPVWKSFINRAVVVMSHPLAVWYAIVYFDNFDAFPVSKDEKRLKIGVLPINGPPN